MAPSTRGEIHVPPPKVNGTQLSCDVEANGYVERFLTDSPFRFTYGFPLGAVPPGILSIPVVSQLVPVAAATGATLTVSQLDRRFERAIRELIEAYQILYPRFMTDIPVTVLESSGLDSQTSSMDDGSRSRTSTSGSGLLFTGGVDSMCSYIRIRDQNPLLISIRGWTISPHGVDDPAWDDHTERLSKFASEHSLQTAFVEANMLEVLDHPMLLSTFSRFVDGGWYSSVGHGLGLLGTTAPICNRNDIDRMYIAATHWEGIDLAWGSRPDLDERVRWSRTNCYHDAYSLTRQERIDTIASHVDRTGSNLRLHTCNVDQGENCGTCEKCLRTAVGLRLAGLEPKSHGYPFDDTSYQLIIDAFEDGRWILGVDEFAMWSDIRDYAREATASTREEHKFYQWLGQADLERLVDQSNPPIHHRLLRGLARRVPLEGYRRLYPLWDQLKRARRRSPV